MKKLTKNQLKEALVYIFYGAFGGYSENWDDGEENIYNHSISSTNGVDVLSRYAGAIKERLMPDVKDDSYLFRLSNIEQFDTIERTLKWIWHDYINQFERPVNE